MTFRTESGNYYLASLATNGEHSEMIWLSKPIADFASAKMLCEFTQSIETEFAYFVHFVADSEDGVAEEETEDQALRRRNYSRRLTLN
jgi:hypothetical protein